MSFIKLQKDNNYGENFKNVEDIIINLKENYVTPGHPIAFSGIQNVYNFYKKKIGIKKIKEILSGIDTYTLTKEYHNQVRNPSYSHFPRYRFEMDIIDFQEHAPYNDGKRYILTVVDTFTRYAFCRILQDKTAENVFKEFQSILTEAVKKPLMLGVDRGMEFRNKKFLDFCKKHNIKIIHPSTSGHAPYVERFNRTIQSLVYKYMNQNQTNRYIDQFQNIVKSYNTRKHSSTGETPLAAEQNPEIHKDIAIKMSKDREKIKKKKPVFSIGDYVRISKMKTKFSRGYHEQSQNEIFKIYGINEKLLIPIYYLQTYNGEEKIEGGFYGFEITKVTNEIYRVEKVLKQRIRNGLKELYVKWIGFDETYNSWIKEADVTNIF